MPPAKAAGANKKPPAKKEPKKQMSDVVAENEKLLQDLESARVELAASKQQLNTVLMRLAGGMDRRWQKTHNVTAPDFDPMQLKADAITDLLDRVIDKHTEHETSVEMRVEQLEKQVTQMSVDLLRNSKKNLAYELGLNDLIKCNDINTLKDRIYELQIIAGEAYHSDEANDLTQCPDELFAMDGITERADCDATREIENANQFRLVPPLYKETGDTYIQDMNNDLKLYIIKELSIEKVSGADWRILAQRVGLAQTTIDELASQNLCNCAGYVLDAWTESCPTATVRLLHRHLMSPMMRCTILCKHLCDFYELL